MDAKSRKHRSHIDADIDENLKMKEMLPIITRDPKSIAISTWVTEDVYDSEAKRYKRVLVVGSMRQQRARGIGSAGISRGANRWCGIAALDAQLLGTP